MTEPSEKILSDIKGKIDREIKLIQGFQAVKKNTSNQEVIQRCNNQIRETQTNIEYLQQTYDKLTLQSSSVLENKHGPGSGLGAGAGGVGGTGASGAPLYTRLDLIKYDCPSLGHKIQYMLQQLQFKLQVENQYREANEKISHLYLMDGDKSSSFAAEGGKLESDQRIQLLNRSLKKFQGMHVSVDEVSRDLEIMNTPKYARKPLSGNLIVSVTCIRDVDHIASPMQNKKPESVVSLKIDDVEKARTTGSRNGRFNEDFTITVDKAHEVEITVYDKSGSQQVPVALTWILLSDIAEEIRKKKVANEMGSDGWMPASRISTQQSQGSPNGGHNSNVISSSGVGGSAPNSSSSEHFDQSHFGASTAGAENLEEQKATQIQTWLNLEPAGQILVTLTFEKSQNVGGRSAFMGALGRHGAIRQKKEEVFEQHGHQFVQKQFYNIMCCALCGEFLRYTGFQCQDCRFLCHKKCYEKVVTKCISKSGVNLDDEAKLNHRIPHRFEPVLNRGTKWCCHCGHILPWGRKNVRKCSECGVMCHTQCTHLVPDFCGMSMEMANKILMTIKSTKPVKKEQQHNQYQQHQQHQLQMAPEPLTRDVPPAVPSKEPSSNYLRNQTQPGTEYRSLRPEPLYVDFSSQSTLQDQQYQSKSYTQAQPGSDLDDEPEQEYLSSKKLPTHSSMQFQEVVESPYDNHAAAQRRAAYGDERQNFNEGYENVQYNGQTYGDTQNYGAYNQGMAAHNQNFDMAANNQIPHLESSENPFAAPTEQFQQLNYNDSVDHSHAVETTINSKMIPAPEAPRAHRSKKRRRKIGLDDFQFLAVLGKGNFGKVMLAELRQTSKLCAIKVLKKDFIVENDEAESVKSEKRVFLVASREKHPFFLNLHCCFQTENRIYFVMEYVSGGDLMWHIQKNRFNARRAKFYACQVLLALKYFHDHGIVYRDLKLDNILLTTQGHIKLGDYGLCKENMYYGNTTSTFCGTPEFMAPEIIASKPYGRSVDWWAFGVLMFQMMLCQSPFKGDDEEEVFNAIEHDEVRYPISMPRQTVLVLQALLTKNPAERLGGGERDALEIMEHPYFEDVNFDDVLNLRVEPPFVPELANEMDFSNFDQEFTSETPRLTPVETVLSSNEQEKFRGFSHISEDATV